MIRSLPLAAAAVAVVACDRVPLSTYSIPSDSMLPTLETGDIIGANGWKGDCGQARPTPGQVVIFRRGKETFVARAIAAPGQTLEMKAGRLSIDGRPVQTESLGVKSVAMPWGETAPKPVFRETLANGASYRVLDFGPDGALDTMPPTRVQGGWFVLGDSRDNSADSRVYGVVPETSICAVATSVIFAKEKSRVGQAL